MICTKICSHSWNGEGIGLGTSETALGDDKGLEKQIILEMLTMPTFAIIRVYDRNAHYVNTKTLNDGSLLFTDDVVDQLPNGTDRQDEGGHQSPDFRHERRLRVVKS